MLNDPNISSPANVDASVEWRDRRAQYIERCKKYAPISLEMIAFILTCGRLAEKAMAEVPDRIKGQIPHPDTDPVQREKRIQKYKILNAPMMTLEDDDEYGSFDFGGSDEMDYDYDVEDYDSDDAALSAEDGDA